MDFSLFRSGMTTWNIIKRKNIYGMYESESNAVAFHLKKPCIDLYGVSFLYERIEDKEKIDYNC